MRPMAVLALLLTLALAACGDDEGGVPAPTTSPPASVTASPAPSPGNSGWTRGTLAKREVANIEWDGALYISNADGSDRVKIGDHVCGSLESTAEISWSPAADRIAAICRGDSPTIEVYHRAGLPVTVIPAIGLPVTDLHPSRGMTLLAWSPDGMRIAFQTLNQTEPPVAHVTLADVLTGEMESLPFKALLLPSGWARPNEILLGLNPGNPVRDDPKGWVVSSEYDAAWYNIETGVTRPVPRFDDNEEFWLEPGADRAVVLTGPPSGTGGDAQLAVYDLTTGDELPIPGAVISYGGSQDVPNAYVEVGRDGDLWWVGYVKGTMVDTSLVQSMHHASLDGGTVQVFGAACAGGVVLDISGDGLKLCGWASPYDISVSDVTGSQRSLKHHKYSPAIAAISPVP